MVNSVLRLEQPWRCGSRNSISLARDLTDACDIFKKIKNGELTTCPLLSLGKFCDGSKHHYLANERLIEAIIPDPNILKKTYPAMNRAIKPRLGVLF